MSVYSRYKIFHYPEKLASLPAGAPIQPPLHVRLKPTNRCNHRCAYCAYRQPDFQLGETMNERDEIPAVKMQEIVDDLIEMGVKAVTFSGGGEPFLYAPLHATAARLVDGGVKIASLTNGARLWGANAELFSAKATWVRVSCDGWDGPSYAAYRRVTEREFSKVLLNLEAFQKLGGPCRLGAIINVDSRNALHVGELARHLADTGLSSLKVAPVIVSNDGSVNAEYHRPWVGPVAEQVAQVQAEYPALEISNGYHAQLASFAKAYTWCPMLQVRPVIAADLQVYSCQDRAYAPGGVLFSVRDQSFLKGWYAGKAQFMRIDPNKECLNHCVGDAANLLIHEYLSIDDESGAYV